MCFFYFFDLLIWLRWWEYNASLPETTDLSSAKRFAECIPLGTQQKNYLPSASETTLGKIMALGIPNSLSSAEKRQFGKLGKNTRQNRDTRHKDVIALKALLSHFAANWMHWNLISLCEHHLFSTTPSIFTWNSYMFWSIWCVKWGWSYIANANMILSTGIGSRINSYVLSYLNLDSTCYC